MKNITGIGLIVIIILLSLLVGVTEHNCNIHKEILQGVIDSKNNMLSSCMDDNYEIMIQAETMIEDLNDTVNTFRDDKRDLEQDIELLEYELQIKDIRFNTAYEIDMRPTYDEVLAFIKADKTDLKRAKDDYDCVQFTSEVIRNAISSGMFACMMTMDLDSDNDGKVDGGHAIVAFNTIDAGVIYVEPQTDDVVYMYEGMNYWCSFTNGDCGNNIVINYDSCMGLNNDEM